jgi:hypothetical protein
MKSVLALVLSAWVLAPAMPSSLEAQVTARQGDPAASPQQEFRSPMILDLPLYDLRSLPNGTGFTFKEVTKFYCEDVVLSQLVVAKNKDRGRPPGLRLEIRGMASVRRSYDRWTQLRFELLRGEERIAFVSMPRLSTEEGQTTPFHTEIMLTAQQAERLFSPGESVPNLRVTVTVVDNS